MCASCYLFKEEPELPVMVSSMDMAVQLRGVWIALSLHGKSWWITVGQYHLEGQQLDRSLVWTVTCQQHRFEILKQNQVEIQGEMYKATVIYKTKMWMQEKMDKASHFTHKLT